MAVPAVRAAVGRAFYDGLDAVPLPVNRADGVPGDLVCVDDLGQPLEATALIARYQTRLRRAGLKRRRFHDLRHGTACLAIAAGCDIKTVQAMLRHSSITTTANIYAKVVKEVRVDAAARLGALLGPG